MSRAVRPLAGLPQHRPLAPWLEFASLEFALAWELTRDGSAGRWPGGA